MHCNFYYLCAMCRKVGYYKRYFWDFFNSQPQKIRDKIVWTIQLIQNVERISEQYFKHIEDTDGLYEIRVQFANKAIRIFCFFDEGQLIIAINGFLKKSQKTPPQEIVLALKIKNDYETEKRQRNANK